MIRPIIVVVCSLFTAVSVFAQGGAPLKTGKKYVTAIVDHGSGWVQVKQFPGNQLSGTYSYPQKSFVSFKVGDKVFTNNDVGLGNLPANTFIIKDGTLSKIGDTIRCVWQNKDGVDLIQEVYPVLLAKSEQIVFRWKANNKKTTSVIVAVQYLLDIQVGVADIINDGSPILTRYGYQPQWDMFTASTGVGVPSFYAAPQHKLPNAPSFDLGITGVGYTDNTFANLELTKPYRLTIGDWNRLIEVRWGPPIPLPNGQYTDAATLLEFTGATVSPNSESLIAATSYGSSEFATCKGQLFGIVFYPLRIDWEPPNLVPNPFPVEMYLFNPQSVQGAPNTKVTLTVGTDLTITSPSPITNNGKRQKQEVQVAGYIPPLGVGVAQWTLQATKSTQCSSDIISSLRFAAESPGLGYPIFVNEADGTDTTEHPIIIECANPNRDTLPPMLEPFVEFQNGDRAIGAHDNRPVTDTGLKFISWKPLAGTDSSNFFISITPPLTVCSKDTNYVLIHQWDSTKGGCLEIVFEDCAGNKSDTAICFSAKYPPYIPDTLAPNVFDKLLMTPKFASFIITDTNAIDTGIRQVTILPPTYGTASTVIDPPLTPCSKLVHQVYLRRTDSLHSECIKYTVSDCAGNITLDSICFPGTLGVASSMNENTFSILGNPSSGKATVQLTLERAQDVTLRIVDAIGREVRRVEVKGLSQGENFIPLQTTELASGTYYVIVEIGGKQFAKSLKVVR